MRNVIVNIEKLTRWLEEAINRSGVDPQVLGIRKVTPEEVRKLYEEHCRGLETGECIETLERLYPFLRYQVFDDVAYRQAMQYMEHYLGTTKISEAFKSLIKQYGREQVISMLDNLEETDLGIIADVIEAKYGAKDIDIREVQELYVYDVKVQIVKYGSIKLFYRQVLKLPNVKPAKTITQLIAHGENLRLAHRNPEALVLIAIFDDTENIILPITQSEENTYMVVLNKENNRAGLVW